jgi:hypothetical protein
VTLVELLAATQGDAKFKKMYINKLSTNVQMHKSSPDVSPTQTYTLHYI